MAKPETACEYTKRTMPPTSRARLDRARRDDLRRRCRRSNVTTYWPTTGSALACTDPSSAAADGSGSARHTDAQRCADAEEGHDEAASGDGGSLHRITADARAYGLPDEPEARGGRSATVAATRRRRGVPLLNSFSRSFLDDSRSILEQVDDTQIEAVVKVLRRDARHVADDSSCAAPAAAPVTRRTRHATSGSSLESSRTPSPTMSRSSLPGSTMTAGTPRTRNGSAPRGSPPRIACSSSRSVAEVSNASVSVNLVRAMHLARDTGASIVGIAGRDGGELRQVRRCVRGAPLGRCRFVTPQTEGLQALVWHLMVSHPALDPEHGEVGVDHRYKAR